MSIYLSTSRLVITWMFIQVFEFLENISDSLTDLAAKELASLKDLKVSSVSQMFFHNMVSCHLLGSFETSEARGRRKSIWHWGFIILCQKGWGSRIEPGLYDS